MSISAKRMEKCKAEVKLKLEYIYLVLKNCWEIETKQLKMWHDELENFL